MTALTPRSRTSLPYSRSYGGNLNQSTSFSSNPANLPFFTPQPARQNNQLQAYSTPGQQPSGQKQGQNGQGQQQVTPARQTNGQVAVAGAGGQQQQLAQDVIAQDVINALERASRAVNMKLSQAEKKVTLNDLLATTKMSQDYIVPTTEAEQPLLYTGSVSFSDELWRALESGAGERSDLKLFPEIGRACLTVGSRLLLWDWKTGQFNTFDELSETIIAVHLATPKPDVFTDGISYVLVIATPTTIHLVGLGFSKPTPASTEPPSLCLYLTHLSASTDSVALLSIASTPSGRIFLASCTPSGSLYELSYRTRETMFSAKCSLTNLSGGANPGSWSISRLIGGGNPTTSSTAQQIPPSAASVAQTDPNSNAVTHMAFDEARDVLWVLHANSHLEIYFVPPTPKNAAAAGQSPPSPERRARADLKTLIYNTGAASSSPMLDAAKLRLVSVSPLQPAAGGDVAAVVTTSTGVRLFLGITRFGYGYGAFGGAGAGGGAWGPGGGSQWNVALVHIRLPPAPAPATSVARPKGLNPTQGGLGRSMSVPANLRDAAQGGPGGSGTGGGGPALNNITQATVVSRGTFVAGHVGESGGAGPHGQGEAVMFCATPATGILSQGLSMSMAGQGRTAGSGFGSGYGSGGGQVTQHGQSGTNSLSQLGIGLIEIVGHLDPSGGPALEIIEEIPLSTSNALLPTESDPAEVPSSGPTAPTAASARRTNALLAPLEGGGVVGLERRRQVLVMTGRGVDSYLVQAPVDNLARLLARGSGLASGGAGGGNAYGQQAFEGDLVGFVKRYGRDHVCSMCLAVAAGSSSGAVDVLANDDQHSLAIALTGVRPSGPDVVSQAKRILYELGGRPGTVENLHQQQLAGAPISDDGRTILSGKHEAVAILVGKCLRPLWKALVTKPSTTRPGLRDCAINAKVLGAVQAELVILKRFLDTESQLFGSGTENRYERNRLVGAHDPLQGEADSLNAIKVLVSHSIEAISFVLLLVDYQLPEIVAACSDQVKEFVTTMTFEQLVTSQKGRIAVRRMVNVIIDRQIAKQISVDTISDVLQQRCGSFCSADDVVMYKAMESVRKAKDTLDRGEQIQVLRESLRLFLKGTKILTAERVASICDDYRSMDFQVGSIDLALACARDWDMDNHGESYWLEGQPDKGVDIREKAFRKRIKCYDVVFQVLQEADDALDEAVRNEDALAVTGKRAESGGRVMTVPEADSLRANAYARALASSDRMFHFSLYDWVVGRGLTDQLLGLHTAFIEEYLASADANLERRELLWQYYARNEQYVRSAEVLQSLAETDQFEISLGQRIEYLSLGISNAKAQAPAEGDEFDAVRFLARLEEALEVAQVQVEVYRAVQDAAGISEEARQQGLRDLDSRLYDITSLYTLFVQPLENAELLLLVLHVSGFRGEEGLVESTWERILDAASYQQDNVLESLSGKIMQLARRFYPSDVFPIGWLCSTLERYSFEYPDQVTEGWITIALHEGGVPYDAIFDAYDEMCRGRDHPWSTDLGLVHISTSMACLLEAWLSDSSSLGTGSSALDASSRSRGRASLGHTHIAFPASTVDDALGRCLLALRSSDPPPMGGDGPRRRNHMRQLQDRLEASRTVIKKRF